VTPGTRSIRSRTWSASASAGTARGRNERGDLDLVQPGARKLVHDLDLGVGRHERLLDLEAVATATSFM
jgi:hypothetical protein